MQRRPTKFSDITFADHHLVGVVWPVISARSGESYDVVLTEDGFTCTCIGAQMHNKCKHIAQIHERLVSDE